jgi:cytidylate kinase
MVEGEMGQTIRAITISREFGAGGTTVARILSERLGWRLVDAHLITEIAKSANIHPHVAERLDECVDPWFHRMAKELWRGGYEGAATSLLTPMFDAEAMAALWRRVIVEAAEIGQCIIVGRGGQCILQHRRDVFHVSLYAPLSERIERLGERYPRGTDLAELAEETDRMRAVYIRRYFGQEWTNRHLYDLLICTSIGVDKVAAAILCAAGLRVAP